MEIKLIKNLPVKRWIEYRDIYLQAVKNEPLAFSETLKEAEKTLEKDWKRRIKEALSGQSVLVFAEFEQKLVGMGAANFHSLEKMKHNAFISGLYVEPEFRKKGVGEKIIELRIEIILKNKEIKNIFTEIIETQKSSIKLHKKLGFEIVGKFKNLFYVDGKFYSEYYLQKQVS